MNSASEKPEHERQLLAAAKRGDEGAFEHLVQPYRGELQAHAYRMVGSLHDAEDATQEAMLRAWRGIGRFEGRSSLPAARERRARLHRGVAAPAVAPARGTDHDRRPGLLAGRGRRRAREEP